MGSSASSTVWAKAFAILVAVTAAVSYAAPAGLGPGPSGAAPGDPIVTSHTNATGSRYHAIPSDDPDDGRFLAIAGSDLATIGGNDIHVTVGVPAGRTEFELSVFDADTNNHWDSPGTSGANNRLMFRLYRDPARSGSQASLLSSWSSDSGVDDAWSVRTFATDTASKAPSGNYFYHLFIAWENAAAAQRTFNNFKLRATAQLGVSAGQDFGFAGGPQDGGDPDVGSGDPDSDPEVNNPGANSYDGQWDWYFYMPSARTDVTFVDGDADRNEDTDDFNTANVDPDGSGEAQAEGAHDGIPEDSGPNGNGDCCNIEPSIFYTIRDPQGNVYTNDDPSGQREFENYIIGPTNADAPVNYTLAPGLWRFRVNAMDAHNFNNLRTVFEIFTDTDIPLTVNPAPEVEPDNTDAASPGELVRYAHTVRNKGTGNDTFDLAVVSSRGWTVRLYHDANGNGLLDAGENETASTGLLTPNQTYALIVEVAVPGGLTASITDVSTVTASSTVEWALQDSAKDTTTVTINNPPTISSFTATSAPEGTAVQFTAAASDPDGDALTYSFDFQDDGTFDATGPGSTASFTWGDDHVGSARVRVSDGPHSVETTTRVRVTNVDPTLTVTFTTPEDEGEVLTVTARIQDPGSDDLTLQWWGICNGWGPAAVFLNSPPNADPDESTDIHPRDVTDTRNPDCGDNGGFSFLASVADDDGGVAAAGGVIAILNLEPNFSVTFCPQIVGCDPEREEGAVTDYFADADDAGSDDLAFRWQWGDGTPDEGDTHFNDGLGPDPAGSPNGTYPFHAGEVRAHPYGDDGAYPITVTVTDDDGGAAVYASQVLIVNVAPTVAAPAPIAGDEGAVVGFTATFSDPGYDQPALGTVEDFAAVVDWGDGTSGTLSLTEVPGGPGVPTTGTAGGTHIYADNGVYPITITVCDDDGGCGQATLEAVIANVAPAVTPPCDALFDEGDLYTLGFADPATPCGRATFTDPGFDFAPAGTVEDFTATVDWGDGASNPGSIIEVPGGPGVPTTGAVEGSHHYADNGIYTVTITVCDDDGGCGISLHATLIDNVAPTVDAGTDQETDEGTLIPILATLSDPGFDFPPAGTVEDFTGEIAWGDGVVEAAVIAEVPGGPGVPTTATLTGAHVYADNGAYTVTIAVCDDDGGCGTAALVVTVHNVVPTVDAGPDMAIDEAQSTSLAATFSDPGFDFAPAGTMEDFTATVAWELRSTQAPAVTEVPGSAGILTTGSLKASEVYGDNGVYLVTVTVCDDDGGCGSDTATLTVGNVDPTIEDVQIFAAADITLRVAGEKFHDVCLELTHNGAVTGAACVVRMPGSPDRQTATISGGKIQLLGDTAITLYYTPDDDPINGRRNGDNPAWVILTFADGSEVRLHHNFNVQHPGTWTWTIDDLRVHLLGKPITFEVAASDVGSDDLRVDIDFGDGAKFSEVSFFDGVSPDPVRSPDLGGKYLVTRATHTYGSAGAYSVTFTLTDDDGGSATRTASLTVG